MRRMLVLAALALSACGGRSQPAEPARPSGKVAVSSSQVGFASWYGPGFAGRKTANGEVFDPSELTCAHRKLPFGTRVRVTNLENGRSVVVRVNDRGPYARGRIIDLSKEAASRIGMIERGHVKVRVEVLAATAAR